MRFYEFSKPKTGQQLRIDSLKQQKKTVSAQLKKEKNSQKKQSALANIQKNNAILSKLNNSLS